MALISAVATSDGAKPEQSGAREPGISMLGVLAIVARHRGINLSPAQLRREHRLGPGEPSLPKLLDIARASGLRAVATRLRFGDLMRLGAALPAILLLKNGSAMVLLRSEPLGSAVPWGDGPKELVAAVQEHIPHQALVVALLLPLLIWMRNWSWEPRVVRAASLAVAAVGLAWFVERLFFV